MGESRLDWEGWEAGIVVVVGGFMEGTASPDEISWKVRSLEKSGGGCGDLETDVNLLGVRYVVESTRGVDFAGIVLRSLD